MSKLVIFEIYENGSFDQGFHVRVRIKQDGKILSTVKGFLVPDREILQAYQKWRTCYYAWGQGTRWLRQIQVPPAQNTNYSSEQACRNAAIELKKKLNDWLSQSNLNNIREELIQQISNQDLVRFILDIPEKNIDLQRLPWHEWEFFKTRYPNAEIAFSMGEKQAQGNLSHPVKILPILGSDKIQGSRKLELEVDWENLKQQFPEADIEVLRKPTSIKFTRTLDDRPWQILFFSGHSRTEEAGENEARIELDERESLSFDQLKPIIKKARDRGLKLAIFNSCDGLGLARDLASVGISHIIVMREAIPDLVAQKFLEYFLESFADNKPLHQAINDSRKLLLGWENYSPCASWLPVIFQNPEESELFYPPPPPPRSRSPFIKRIISIAGSILLGLVLAISPSFLPCYSDSTCDAGISIGEEILVENPTPEKQAGVDALNKGNYPDAVAYFRDSLESNPNDPETLIYLNNTRAANVKVGEPVKIAVSLPIGSNQPVAEEILRGLAQIQQKINNEQGGINGRLLQIVIANDNNDGDLAKKRAERFVKDTTILAVVGHNASNATIAAAPTYKSGKLVTISPTSFDDGLKEKSYLFRMVPQMTFFAAKLANSVVNQIPNSKVATCSDPDSADNDTFRNQFVQILSANGGEDIKILSCQFLPNDNFDPNSVVKAIEKNNANSLLIAPYVDRIPEVIEIFKAVREKNLSIKLYSSPTLYTEKTLQLGEEAVEGLTMSVPWYPNSSVHNSFSSNYQNLWHAKINTWRTAMSYDATLAISTALQRISEQKSKQQLSQEEIREQLNDLLRDQSFRIDGVTGVFHFDRNTGERQPQNPSDALIQIQNGQFVRVE